MTKTPKTTERFIRIAIVGYIPAAHILNKESVMKQFDKLANIEGGARAEMEVESFKARPVGRLVAAEPDLKDTPHLDENLEPIDRSKDKNASDTLNREEE